MLGVTALLLGAASPAGAARLAPPTYVPGALSTFAGARAAVITGDVRRAATLYAALVADDPGSRMAAERAIGNALAAGEFVLALRLASARPLAALGTDARLLIAAQALRTKDFPQATAALGKGNGADLRFLLPLVQAWSLAERGDPAAAAPLLQLAEGSGLWAYCDEQLAFLLLRTGQVAEARPLLSKVLARPDARAAALRLSFADALLATGDRAGAIELLANQRDSASFVARASIARGAPLGMAVRTPAEAIGQVLTAIAIDLGQANEKALPIALSQVARFAAPGRADAAVISGMLQVQAGRVDDGLASFRQVPDTSPLASAARDAEVRALIDSDRRSEALARARVFVAGGARLADDVTRVGDVLSALGREAEAAEAFGQAAALVEAGGPGNPPWTLHLLRGGALERGGRWAEAEPVLERALALAPNNPVVLNYLGYARLERGQDLAGAEAMIARASALRPNDPSITDSLGWAQYRQGRFAEAIATLGRAAAGDPGQAEIHEHLGDALFAAGRRFEARFAWEAARVVAADEAVAMRLRIKLANGVAGAASPNR